MTTSTPSIYLAGDTVTDAEDHDRFAHYFARVHIEEALFEGTPCEALCGKWDVPTRDFTKYPVCPECKNAFERLDDE